MSYADPSDLKGKFRSLGERFTSVDIQKELDEANRRVHSNIGKHLIDVRYRDRGKDKYDLDFGQILEFKKILFEDGLVNSDAYTVDEEEGTVEFNEDVLEEMYMGGQIEFYYVPERFKDLELTYAIEQILELTSTEMGDELKATKTEKLAERIKHMEDRLKSRGNTFRTRDHKPWQHIRW